MKKIYLIAAILVVSAAAIIGVARASVPDSNGTIHSCYKTSGAFQGQVRIIDDSAQSCEASETGLSWPSSSGVTGYSIVTGSTISIAPNNFETETATCTAGKKVVGGGMADTGTNLVFAVASFPSANDTWEVKEFNSGGTSGTTGAYAVCVNG